MKCFSPKITDALIDEIALKIENARNILLFPHQRADGDGFGAALCFREALRARGKNAAVALIDEPIPRAFAWLPEAEMRLKEFTIEDYDLVIFIDHSETWRTGFDKKYLGLEAAIKNLIIIDHHAVANLPEKILNMTVLIDEHAPATSMLLFEILRALEMPITAPMATCLLAGIYTDTGSFQHSNATPDAHRIAGELIAAGGELEAVKTNIFKYNDANRLQLWGRVLGRAKKTRHGFVVTAVTEIDFRETGTSPDDLGGIESYLRGVPDMRALLILREQKDGMIRGSFRTEREDVDVAKISAIFGGGGHRKAAGFTVQGHLKKETGWRVE